MQLDNLEDLWIKREITTELQSVAATFPVVTLSGPRQVGKTSVLERTFSDLPYVSLDIAANAEMAETRPADFLRLYPFPAGALFSFSWKETCKITKALLHGQRPCRLAHGISKPGRPLGKSLCRRLMGKSCNRAVASLARLASPFHRALVLARPGRQRGGPGYRIQWPVARRRMQTYRKAGSQGHPGAAKICLLSRRCNDRLAHRGLHCPAAPRNKPWHHRPRRQNDMGTRLTGLRGHL